MPLATTPYARGNPAHWWKSRSCGRGSRAPGSMFVSPLRRTLGIGSLSLLTLTLAGGWYMTRPARISRMAEALLTNVIGGKVTVRTGHLSLSGTLLLSGVDIHTDNQPGQLSLPIFSADQIEARFDWLSLLLGELRSTQLTALRPTLYLVEDHDLGKWNYEVLHKKSADTKPAGPSRKVNSLPVIAMREARIQWGEVSKGHLAETTAAVVDGQFTPSIADPSEYHFSLTQRIDTPGAASNTPASSAPIVVAGIINVNDNRLSAKTDEIQLDDSVRDALPSAVRTWWNDHDLTGSFSKLWVTFDNDNGVQVGAVADHLGMVLKVTPSADGKVYNIKLANVSGAFTFGVTKPGVSIQGLEGRVLGFRFKADGEVGGLDPTALALNIQFPGAILGEDYPPLFVAFPPSQDLMQRLAPHGKFDLSLELRRGEALGTGDKVLVNGNVLCHDARMRFGPLPYPLTHMNGTVEFNQESVTFHSVTANADDTLVHIEGITGTTPSFPKIDFKVWSDNAIFDDRLAACLPEKFANVWNQFVMTGKGGFACAVTRDNDPNLAPDVRVDVTITDGSGYAKALPYRFYNAHGALSLSSDKTDVHNLTIACGADHSGSVRLNGVIHHPGGDVANLLPDLAVNADIPLENRLIKALPEEASALLKGITLGGRVGFNGTVQRKSAQSGDPMAGVHLTGAVTMTDGSVQADDGAWAISQIAASAELQDGKLQMDSVSADILHGIRLGATGNFDLLNRQGALQLTADADHFTLPSELPHVAPAAAREAWTAYHPAGTIDLHAQATITLRGGSSNPADIAPGVHLDAYACTLTAQGVTLTNTAWPESLDNIHGKLQVNPGEIRLRHITAATGPATLSLNADYATDTGASSLTGTLASKGLPGQWMTKLPTGLRSFFDANKTTGDLTLTIDRLSRQNAKDPWKFKAALAISHLTSASPFPITADRIGIAGSGSLADSAFDFDGKIDAAMIGLGSETLDTLNTDLTISSTEHLLRLSNINGSVAGGSLQGTIRIEPDGDGRYDADLALKDAALAGLLLPRNASAEDRSKVGQGRVSATLAVQQTFGSHADRTGRGELIVQDGKIYNVPLAMGLMQIVTLRLPVARAFDRVDMSYFLRDSQVTFEKILLESPSINLAGSGTLSLVDKSLDLNFVTESPNELKLPIISPIINTIRAELLQLAVTGTLDNPRVTPVPLSALSAPLRALLPHHQQASEK